MSRASKSTAAAPAIGEIAPPLAPTPVTDLLSSVTPSTSAGRAWAVTLGPWLSHRPECTVTDDGCSCGLVQAFCELRRVETLASRYGSFDV